MSVRGAGISIPLFTGIVNKYHFSLVVFGRDRYTGRCVNGSIYYREDALCRR